MTEKYEQILSYLDKTSKILVSWLEKALPELSPNWWENNVVAKLSDVQRTMLEIIRLLLCLGLI
jgi:hypothetical protein